MKLPSTVVRKQERPKPSLRKERGEVGLRHAFLAVRMGARVFEKRVFFSERRSQVVVSAPLG